MITEYKTYDNATEKLAAQAAGFGVPADMVRALRESFKQQSTYLKVFRTSRPDWPKNRWSTNYCAVASYYIYISTGGYARWDMVSNPIHYWLELKTNGEIFDITYDQFTMPPDYNTHKLAAAADPDWLRDLHHLQRRAMILGKCAGLES
ncbi:MAG: hypothetical protein FWG39_02955 [Alphaproteobacteria bacterium]|nr:hypothetical protein [Alphaproteobacteria bacterium]